MQGVDETLIHKSGGIGQNSDQPNSYFDLWTMAEWGKTKNGRIMQRCFFKAAFDFIGRRKSGDQPFFVYLQTNAPHTPLDVDRLYWEPCQKAGFNETTARVYGMISNLDENVGKLMAFLEKFDLLDSMIVIFMGDNGAQQKRFVAGLRERKSWTYEGGIRVPFLAQWRGKFQKSTKRYEITAHFDIMTILLSLTKTPRPKSLVLDGIDLSDFLRDKQVKSPGRSLFFQVHRGFTPQQSQNSAVVVNRFKLVGYPGIFGNENLMRNAKPTLELYDILADPREQNNLIQSNKKTKQELCSQYET